MGQSDETVLLRRIERACQLEGIHLEENWLTAWLIFPTRISILLDAFQHHVLQEPNNRRISATRKTQHLGSAVSQCGPYGLRIVLPSLAIAAMFILLPWGRAILAEKNAYGPGVELSMAVGLMLPAGGKLRGVVVTCGFPN
jgi:hypothetical protein